ncbi:MAG: hypothetical protein N838_28650 [Thiohalocapsa sp. PB-PSB1]|nr:MAG: hypothetical protein N838_28650 [Thiohalocapsa sp. PB-PSB1]
MFLITIIITALPLKCWDGSLLFLQNPKSGQIENSGKIDF